MGFPENFKVSAAPKNKRKTEAAAQALAEHNPSAVALFGNAVCPPVIALVAGRMLDQWRRRREEDGKGHKEKKKKKTTTKKSPDAALALAASLALEAVPPCRVPSLKERLRKLLDA